MALTRLTCDSIGELDEGRARGIIDAALAVVYRDIEERGHDEKSRSLQITVQFLADKGLIVTDVQAKATLPPYRTNLTAAVMRAESTKKGTWPVLCFQEHDGANPDQSTFEAMDVAEDGEIVSSRKRSE